MEHPVTLLDGLKVGDTTHKRAILREPTAGDIIDAQAEGERLVATPDGYQLITSPHLVGLNVLRRQIVKIGDHSGPLAIEELRRLSPRDLAALQDGADALDAADLTEVEKRGRAEPPSGGD